MGEVGGLQADLAVLEDWLNLPFLPVGFMLRFFLRLGADPVFC